MLLYSFIRKVVKGMDRHSAEKNDFAELNIFIKEEREDWQ